MAENAVIGALRVNLGLDSAAFVAGLKRTETSLAGLSKTMSGISRTIGTAFAGFAAGAASALTLSAAIGKANQALEEFGNIADAAKASGVTTDIFQGLTTLAAQSGVSVDQVSSALATFAKNTGLAEVGKGKLVATLQKLNPELLKELQTTTDQNERLRLAADAIDRARSAGEKAALSTALFGDAGAKMSAVFEGGAVALDAWIAKARDMGLIVDRDVIAKADQMGDSFDLASKILDTQLKEAFVDLAPVMVAAAGFASDVATAINKITDSVKSLSDRSRTTLENQRAGIMDLLGNSGSSSDMAANPMQVSLPDSQREELTKQLAEIDAELRRRALDDLRQRLLELPKDVEDLTPKAPAGVEQMASRLESIRQSLMSEEQLEQDSYAKRLASLQEFYNAGLIQRGEYETLLEKAQQEHGDRMAELVRSEVEEESRIRQTLLGDAASIFGSLSSIAESFGEKNLAVAKGFAVAQAIVSTAAGMMKAFEQTGVLGFAGAAAIAAEGAAQIATILSTNSGSSRSPSVGGGSGLSTAAMAEPAAASRGIHIEIVGDTFSKDTVKSLFDQISDELGINGLELVTTYKGA